MKKLLLITLITVSPVPVYGNSGKWKRHVRRAEKGFVATFLGASAVGLGGIAYGSYQFSNGLYNNPMDPIITPALVLAGMSCTYFAGTGAFMCGASSIVGFNNLIEDIEADTKEKAAFNDRTREIRARRVKRGLVVGCLAGATYLGAKALLSSK